MSAYYENVKLLYQGLLAGSAALLYTSPAAVAGDKAARSVMLTEVLIANVDSAARNLTLYIVPSGGSAGDDNTIVPASEIEEKSFTRLTFATVIPAGATLKGFASSANKICLTVTGVERIPINK